MYLLVPMQREVSLIFHRNSVYGHFEQVCETKWVNCEIDSHMFYKIDLSALICHSCEKNQG